MRQRAQIIGGEELNEMNDLEDFEKLQVTDSGSDDNENDLESETVNRFEKTANLIYNESDNEDENHTLERAPVEKRSTSKRNTKFNIFDMVKNTENDKNHDNEAEDIEINSEDIHSRLAESVDSDESDAEITIKPTKKVRIRMVESDSEDENVKNTTEHGIDEINSEDIRERLAELNDSDDTNEKNPKMSTKKFNRIIDSDEEDSDVENNQSSVNTTKKLNGNNSNNNKKRERSTSDDEMSAKSFDTSIAKKRKSQQIVDSDDENNK